jgi:hypothetical protein
VVLFATDAVPWMLVNCRSTLLFVGLVITEVGPAVTIDDEPVVGIIIIEANILDNKNILKIRSELNLFSFLPPIIFITYARG